MHEDDTSRKIIKNVRFFGSRSIHFESYTTKGLIEIAQA
jgi:hypothetical protein